MADAFKIIKLATRCSWLAFALLTLGGVPTLEARIGSINIGTATANKEQQSNRSPPTLHNDRSYTIRLPDGTKPGATKSVVVTPMTIVYDYELYDGEMVYREDFIPNLGFDYAVLEMGSIRNIHRDTGEPVSLDEVYLHHSTLKPIYSFGAETLSRKSDDPILSFPDGYAMHVRNEIHPSLSFDTHILSNKNLAPIDGSLELARKECNECYYAPGKGPECTLEASGTNACCGHSHACMNGLAGECSCPVTTTAATKSTTKYRMEMDFLVSKDLDSFQNVNMWMLTAASCTNCGGGSFHQVPQQSNEEPYYKSTSTLVSPASGTIVYAQSHLHTGGVNATIYRNGIPICSNTAEHGTNPDPSTNTGNEQNHIVSIDSCYDKISSTGIHLDIGDVLTTESYYYGGNDDARFSSELAAGEHKNAMSIVFVGIVFDQIKLSGVVIDRWSIPTMPLMINDFSKQASLILRSDRKGLRGGFHNHN